MLDDEFLKAIGSDEVQAQAYERFMGYEHDDSVAIWSRWGKIGDTHSGATYSGLVAHEYVDRALAQPGWDVRIEGHRPGFSESYGDGERTVSYEPIGSEGVAPLVHIRAPVERFPRDFIFPEEFLLLFDLHRGTDGNWYSIDEAGNEAVAIEIASDRVVCQTGLVRRYQAVKQMALEFTIDSDVFDARLAGHGELRLESHQKDSIFTYYRGPLHGEERWFSRLLGKTILSAPPIEECGLWPYEAPQLFESFAYELDRMGRPIEFSADPDGLANYFGANPDAPNYVTPVMFRKEVLEKYYRAPDRYSVEDGYLRRGGYWGVRIDNEDPDYVVVMLGDLGRDLPYAEQKYWKSFNVARRGEFSKTAVARGFHGQFADAAALDLQFRRLYPEVNAAWRASFGWPLFLEPSPADAHLLDQVRLLPADQQGAFDEQVLGIAKLIVDSLNERDIGQSLPAGPPDEKGISKLERFLHQGQAPSPDSVIDTLRELQAIRSSGSAHRKGQKFEKVRAGAKSDDRRLWWADLLEQSIRTLEDLRSVALAHHAP